MNSAMLEQWMQNIQQTANGAARMARDFGQRVQDQHQFLSQLRNETMQLRQQMQQWGGQMENMNIRNSIGTGAGRPDLLHIEDLPGRRIPFDIVVSVAIESNITSPVTTTYTLSMDGPFICVARAAVLVSSYTFQVTDGQEITRYVGRSYGRQRPISSHLDLLDAQQGHANVPLEEFDQYSCPDDAPPVATIAVPNGKSPFRTMEWDGFIEMSSTVYPRQSSQVPSGLWAPGFSQRMELPVLDYWEKGDVIQFKVEATHTNNPAAGNVQSVIGAYPYLDGGYDQVEGIMYPAFPCDTDATDVVQRSPDAIMYLHLIGYKILQPAGVAVR